MNLITVIPLSRQKVAPTLSYFTSSTVPIGAIVTVPLRSKSISAIVTDTRPVADVKADVKAAPFEIRRLGAVKATAFFPPAFIDACRTLALHYATTTGSVIDSLVPDILLENAHKITSPHITPQETATAPTIHETYVVQADENDRISAWRSLIRQEFARKKSIIFHVPTHENARNLFALLEKGIEGYIFTLHAKLAKKEIVDTWELIATTEHPVVIIRAGSFTLTPRSDISTIIIESENGRGWISQKHPYIDIRTALETIHSLDKNPCSLYLADSLVRIETLKRLEDNMITQGSPLNGVQSRLPPIVLLI